MARLSNPPTSTPNTERKSSRLRDMFKHRPLNSTSGSLVATSNPIQDGSSPIPSPTVKPGFQQVGLLPNERSMSILHDLRDLGESGVKFKSSAEFFQNDEVLHKDVSGLRDLDTNSDVTGVTHEDQVSNKLNDAQAVETEISTKRSFRDAMLKHHGESKGDSVSTAERSISSSYTPTPFLESVSRDGSLPLGSSHETVGAMQDMTSSSPTNQKLSPTHASSPASGIFHMDTTDSEGENTAKELVGRYEDTKIRRTNEFLKSKQGSADLRPTVRATITNDDGCDGLVKQTNRFKQVYGNSSTDPEATHSHANANGDIDHFDFAKKKISNDDSSLPKDLREYITNEISSALKDRIETIPGSPAGAKLHINVSGIATLRKLTAPTTTIKPVFLRSPKTIGSFTITNTRFAQDIQLAVIAVYCLILLSAALLGPKSLLLAMWRMAVVLVLYAIILRVLEKDVDVMQDVVIAPVVYAAIAFQQMLSDVGGVLLDTTLRTE